jgi:hypothetical protein
MVIEPYRWDHRIFFVVFPSETNETVAIDEFTLKDITIIAEVREQ